MIRPVLLPANPNSLDDRAAMGLPSSYLPTPTDDLTKIYRELLDVDPIWLAELVENQNVPFSRRLAAGTILGLIGDPRINPDDPEMVEIPAGEFSMGLSNSELAATTARWAHVGVIEEWIAKECPAHPARVADFAIMKYLVTNGEWLHYVRETGTCELPTSWRFGAYPRHRSNHPVWTVSADAADAYAAWLSSRTGRCFRLPREAEWEYAAGAGKRREFPWGDTLTADVANVVETGPLTTTPVGCFPAGRSPFGVDDMAGNVEEYVAEDYRPYPGAVQVADDLASGGTYRVARGGSFTRFADLARVRRRHGYYRREIYAMGLRLVESR